MNKKKFLKLLEERLQILSEEERKDIINEYKDTIEEKVRHGSSEEEAVADFGSMEELSREILKAYKINPDYSKNKEESSKEKMKDIASQSETLIKKGAKKLSEWTKEMIDSIKNNDQNWTLETIFEILIKGIILLIGLSLLRIPFYWIELLGMNIFEVAFPPLDLIFKILLRCFTCILYFALCIIIIIIVFQPYFTSNEKKSKKKEKSNKEIKTSIVSEKEIQTETSKNNGLFSFFKGLIFLFLIFPLYCIDFGCYIASTIILLLLIQGVPVVGIFLLLLSVSIFFTFLTRFCYQLLYGGKKVYCYSLIISAILFASGFFLTLSTIANFEYYNGLPNNTFKKKQMIYQETLNAHDFKIAYWNYQIEENNMLEDDQVEIMVEYYPDFVTDLRKYTTATDETIFMHFKTYHQNITRSSRKKLYQMIIDGLKEESWYEYRELTDLSITVKVNHNTISKIQ